MQSVTFVGGHRAPRTELPRNGNARCDNIHDLAHLPTQHCLADFLTKASVIADNLITAVQTRKWLDVDIDPDFRTVMEHKASCLLPQHSQDPSCKKSQRKTISRDVCGDSDQRATRIEYT